MITQNLIELIHSGKAKYQTWTAGYTGSFRIPVPKNNYIVITDFTIFNFIDEAPYVQSELGYQFNPLKNCIHNILFKSYGNEFLYVHRSNFINAFTNNNTPIPSPGPQPIGRGELYMPLNNTDKYDTYQVHKSDVHIDCWRIPPLSENNFVFNPLNDKTTETDGPQGYGTVSTPNNNKVIKGVQLEPAFDPTDRIVFYGENQGVSIPGYSEKLRSHINSNTALYPPFQYSAEEPTDEGMYTFPLFNIGYVLVNEAFDKNDR